MAVPDAPEATEQPKAVATAPTATGAPSTASPTPAASAAAAETAPEPAPVRRTFAPGPDVIHTGRSGSHWRRSSWRSPAWPSCPAAATRRPRSAHLPPRPRAPGSAVAGDDEDDEDGGGQQREQGNGNGRGNGNGNGGDNGGGNELARRPPPYPWGMKQSRNPETIHAPVGRYVHQIEVSGEGRMLFLSGQVGMRPDGSVPEDPVDQFARLPREHPRQPGGRRLRDDRPREADDLRRRLDGRRGPTRRARPAARQPRQHEHAGLRRRARRAGVQGRGRRLGGPRLIDRFRPLVPSTRHQVTLTGAEGVRVLP